MTRLLVRLGGALVVATLLVGPAAQASAPGAMHSASGHARPAAGYAGNEWLMMGRNCSASVPAL